MPVQFIESTTGLRPEHLAQTPLLEKVWCPRGADCEVMRVYGDGALYLQDRRDPAAPAWSYLTQVKDAGLRKLEATFDGLCGLRGQPPTDAAAEGAVTYRWSTSACAREVVVQGVSYGDWAPLAEVPNIVNGNLVPRSSAR